jgi:hypothetical protein
MIGRTRLKRIASDLQRPGQPVPCRGQFVLATQRALYGSETVSLDAGQLREVVRYFDEGSSVGQADRPTAAWPRVHV